MGMGDGAWATGVAGGRGRGLRSSAAHPLKIAPARASRLVTRGMSPNVCGSGCVLARSVSFVKAKSD